MLVSLIVPYTIPNFIFTNNTDVVVFPDIDVRFTLQEIYAKVYLELEEDSL
ncbi:hypothetical protein KDK_31640 [Dictyobacter kobayashii]|uniref:Uncharacterized protein n=1 Tax=Dictyobacter kobayashii TaxID=2014872 RepID=A0A402AJY3_9CHLR|nr:hypothetical protein KDK_31640 [Dictyobacter kobayashii]